MTTFSPYPHGRPRRLRRDTYTRNLERENRLTAHDLIYPVFVVDGQGQRVPIASMPGVERLSLDLLLPVAEDCVKLGIPVMALFPVIDASLKTPDGKEALALLPPDSLLWPMAALRLSVACGRLGHVEGSVAAARLVHARLEDAEPTAPLLTAGAQLAYNLAPLRRACPFSLKVLINLRCGPFGAGKIPDRHG